MNRINLPTMQAFASVLIFLLSACAEDPVGDGDQTGKGHTVTLRLSASVVPIPETKASVKPANSGSKAEAVGFYSEMVSSYADRAATTPGVSLEPMPPKEENTDINFATKALATKAPATLKNAYALLFTSTGAFNGRADIGAFAVETATYINFMDVKTTTATNCRLVVVANDNAAATPYAYSEETGGFANFSGTYADFQRLIITSDVNQDTDVPYAGSAIVNLSQSEIGATAEITLSWTLAKITLKNHTFNIIGGPARSSITLYNAGARRFATQGSDDYNGTGNTQTTDFVASTAGSNAPSVTWYVGENIQPAVASIQTKADRNKSNAPINACYIQIKSATQSVGAVTSPKIGEEYTLAGTKSFTYNYYLGNSSILTDFALRRHTDYVISTEISGTMAIQEEIAAHDGRVTLTKPESAGLAIGPFGAFGYTAGTGNPTTVTGSYTKLLLLEPNTSRTTAMDNVSKQWSTNTTTRLQTENRKYWDHTYTSTHIEKSASFAYDYCYNLTLGGVAKGTWYLPTHAQVLAMWSVLKGMQETNSFANYSAFNANSSSYWSSTENSTITAWNILLDRGYGSNSGKTGTCRVRCVRDATSSLLAPIVSTSTGYPAIDLSTLNSLGCVLSSSEAVTRREAMYAPGVTPSNSAFLPVGVDISGHRGTWNTNMSAKYQVMRTNHTIGATDFANAWNTCKEYVGEGGSKGTWRLPTQRELDMVWVLHPQLIGKAGFTAFGSTDYWSSTEDGASSAWYLHFSDGYPNNYTKTVARTVRCIRDL